jgi:hypothetical protein
MVGGREFSADDVACVAGFGGFEEDYFGFFISGGAMLYTPRHHNQISWSQFYDVVAELYAEAPLPDKE